MAHVGAVCQADSRSDAAKENAELRKRVEKLEKELAELKKIVFEQTDKKARTVEVSEPKPEPAEIPKAGPSVRPQLSEADLQKIISQVQKNLEKKKAVWSNLDIQLYGYIKADASYDTSRTTPGNFALWVDSEATSKNDNEFNLTANQTRIGLKISGPEDEGIVTSGRIEIDFFEGGAQNKPRIQMRHAYLKIDWPDKRFDIIAGQTSDVISPLCPDMLNYTVLWDAGNIGYRRPQIRLTKSFAVARDIDLTLEGAVARTIGRNNALAPASESGEDAGYPTLQGRASLTFPWLKYKPATVGFSGHWGKEEYDTKPSGVNKKFDSWSANLDVTQPVNEWLTIKGETFCGENLGTYFGGIGQSVVTDVTKSVFFKEIGSRGGWLAANLGPWGKWSFNVGAGMDDVDGGDVNAGDRTFNRSVFANTLYSINKNTKVGFELSQWHTERKGETDADSWRAQTSFIYSF